MPSNRPALPARPDHTVNPSARRTESTPLPNRIYFGDNLPILQALPDDAVDLIYIDPPFNTGKSQKRTQIKTVHAADGDRTGFRGKRYQTITTRGIISTFAIGAGVLVLIQYGIIQGMITLILSISVHEFGHASVYFLLGY